MHGGGVCFAQEEPGAPRDGPVGGEGGTAGGGCMCHSRKINFLSLVGNVAICRDREGTACVGGACRDSEKALKVVLSCGGLWERKLSRETSSGTIKRPPEVAPIPQLRGRAFLPNRDEHSRALGWRAWGEGGPPAFSEKSPQPEGSCRTGERLQPEGAEASGGGTGCIEIKEVGE